MKTVEACDSFEPAVAAPMRGFTTTIESVVTTEFGQSVCRSAATGATDPENVEWCEGPGKRQHVRL